MFEEEKYQQLAAEMTLYEKVSLLAGADLWHTMPLDRLGIPQIRVTDGPNGARGANGSMAPGSVCTPVGVALAATWNPGLVKRVGQVLGQETKAKGAHMLLAPTVNIHRSPLAGRNFECYSEDPHLTAQMAVAYIQGLQSEGVSACIKHFVANDSEFERMSMSSEVSERTLQEIYLYPFRIAVRDAKPWALMSAYNRVNGVFASEHTHLLLEVLKGEWGFDGLVVSDWFGTYSPDVTPGGLDLEMPGPARWMAHAAGFVEAGTVDEALIDDKVIRLLRTIDRVGAFEDPTLKPEQAINLPEHRQVMLQAAQEAIVLLKNEDDILPVLPQKYEKIAVIGPNALIAQPQGGGSAQVTPHYAISPLAGIQARVGQACEIAYAMGTTLHRALPRLEPNWLSNEVGEKGFTVALFDNPDLSGSPFRMTATDRTNITWSNNFLKGVSPEVFSARLTATLAVPETGKYKLGLQGNGLYRIWVDGKVEIAHWPDAGNPDVAPWESGGEQVDLDFEVGVSYKIQIDYSWKGTNPWRMLNLGCLPPLPEDMLGEAVAAASEADLAVVVVGLTPEWESEGADRLDMKLPNGQDDLVAAVAAANPNTIVVLNNGSPVSMPWLDQVKGLVHMWYAGQEAGNALADVLFGDVNPSGKLPTTFPKRLQDNPAYLNYPGENGSVIYGEGLFVGYRYYDKKDIAPLFPFGYGLSYTQFEFSDLEIDSSRFAEENTVTVQLKVRNIGDRAGAEVVQVYVRDVHSRLVRPEKELKAFAKVDLAPGEQKLVKLVLDQDALAYYDPKMKKWVVEPGVFEVLVGNSSRSVSLAGEFAVTSGGRSTAGGLHIGMSIGQLLDDPRGRIVLEKHLPELLSHPQLKMALPMTLEMIAPFAAEFLTKDKLAAIDADLQAVGENKPPSFAQNLSGI